MGHVVRVKCVQLVAHSFYFLTIHLNLLFVLFETFVRLKQQVAEVLNVQTHCVCVGARGSVGSSSLAELSRVVLVELHKLEGGFLQIGGKVQRLEAPESW